MSSPWISVFVARKGPKRAAGRARVLFMLTVAVVLGILAYAGTLTVAVAVTFFGLATDVVGAITLALGLLRVDMARLAQAMDRNISVESNSWRRLPLWIARRWGSREPTDTEPYTIEEYAEALYGVLLLVLGFILQGIGVWLASR